MDIIYFKNAAKNFKTYKRLTYDRIDLDLLEQIICYLYNYNNRDHQTQYGSK